MRAETVLQGALIGCGFFADIHLHAWKRLEGQGRARIAAACDRDEGRLERAKNLFGIERTYTDAAQMFAAETLDFVDIATTAGSHRALVELAAFHRVPVICQKPLAPTYPDAKVIVETCEQAGLPLMVHENFRWQTPIRAVRQVIDSGRVGKPFWGRISFRSGRDVFSAQPYLATGERFILEDLGVHALDIARFLLGDAERLCATVQSVNPNIRGEDVATVLLRHEGGAACVMDCSYATKLEEDLFPQTLVEIDGTQGTIRLGKDFRLTVTTPEGTEHSQVAPNPMPWTESPWHLVAESVLRIQEHWVDCLTSGRAPDTSGRDNLKTYALVEGAYRSAASGDALDPRALAGSA
ncbi:MAG TPA: Gfo/Idh/MocA family oxidoreductase [Mesorhizobium sp.]|nr:Gfo/Idh/MocA family oxidoreductase [Mesorhizobium sp.]